HAAQRLGNHLAGAEEDDPLGHRGHRAAGSSQVSAFELSDDSNQFCAHVSHAIFYGRRQPLSDVRTVTARPPWNRNQNFPWITRMYADSGFVLPARVTQRGKPRLK